MQLWNARESRDRQERVTNLRASEGLSPEPAHTGEIETLVRHVIECLCGVNGDIGANPHASGSFCARQPN